MRSPRTSGIEYEEAVQREFTERFGPAFSALHIFTFTSHDGTRRSAQPDGILQLPDRITVVEAKERLTSRALFQLTQIYGPLVRAYYEGKPVHYLIVAKDAKLPVRGWPDQPHLAPTPLETRPSGVWLWTFG